MDQEEINRRSSLDKEYVGNPYQLDGYFSFINKGTELSGNPLVSYRGPTTKAVRRTFADAGFIPSNDHSKFNILWGNPQNKKFMRNLVPGQLIPHIAGQYCLTRKDTLATTLEDACLKNPIFRIIPKSFSLPESLSQYELYTKKNPGYYVVKSANAARGEGVKIIHSADNFKVKNAVVQEYIMNPLLINEHKFDIRLYVCVTNVEPLTAYIFNEGLGRFATSPFKLPQRNNIKDQKIHLTNYSVNKDTDQDIGDYKWRFTDVLKYLDKEYKVENAKRMYDDALATENETPSQIAYKNIMHVVRLTLIAGEPKMVSESSMLQLNNLPSRQFGFFGFDIMLLDTLEARLVEVNVNPSTATEHQIDVDIKYPMLRDMLQLVCIPSVNNSTDKVYVPRMLTAEKRSSTPRPVQLELFKLQPHESKYSNYKETGVPDKIYYNDLSRYEKAIIDKIQIENKRKGSFVNLLPNKHYNQYFIIQRYLNSLVCADIVKE